MTVMWEKFQSKSFASFFSLILNALSDKYMYEPALLRVLLYLVMFTIMYLYVLAISMFYKLLLLFFSYSRMYKDVRAAVDLCHRDGTLKQMVAKDPKR